MSKKGPLHDVHEQQRAKFADFGGWLMPLEFAGGGVLAEHQAVREAVGIFDVSHMGTLTVTGDGAKELLNAVLTNDLNRIEAGQAQYSLLCDETGGVIDDLLVYLRSDDDLLIVPNASNCAEVAATLERAAQGKRGVVVADISERIAIIAVQGPMAATVLTNLGLPADLGYMRFVEVQHDGADVLVARSGYTGERGFELLADVRIAEQLWREALLAATELGGLACGLGARDTLRTEMGYPLHGHELSPDITPVQAGLSWAVGWDKPEFAGKAALAAQREAGPAVRLRGLRCTQRAVPRAGMQVRRGVTDPGEQESPVGVVTSGTFSPSAREGIALALLDANIALGDTVSIDVRGRPCEAQVVSPPFVAADPR